MWRLFLAGCESAPDWFPRWMANGCGGFGKQILDLQRCVDGECSQGEEVATGTQIRLSRSCPGPITTAVESRVEDEPGGGRGKARIGEGGCDDVKTLNRLQPRPPRRRLDSNRYYYWLC